MKQKKLQIVATDHAAIGNRIAEIRHKMGMSQVEFAELIGTTRGRLSQLEIGRNEVTIADLRAIASKCSTTYQHIIDGVGDYKGRQLAAEPRAEYLTREQVEQMLNERFSKK